MAKSQNYGNVGGKKTLTMVCCYHYPIAILSKGVAKEWIWRRNGVSTMRSVNNGPTPSSFLDCT